MSKRKRYIIISILVITSVLLIMRFFNIRIVNNGISTYIVVGGIQKTNNKVSTNSSNKVSTNSSNKVSTNSSNKVSTDSINSSNKNTSSTTDDTYYLNNTEYSTNPNHSSTIDYSKYNLRYDTSRNLLINDAKSIIYVELNGNIRTVDFDDINYFYDKYSKTPYKISGIANKETVVKYKEYITSYYFTMKFDNKGVVKYIGIEKQAS